MSDNFNGFFSGAKPGSVMRQSPRNANSINNFNNPDPDARRITLTVSDGVITPNFYNFNTINTFISPVNDSAEVTIAAPINTANKTLHWFVFDNTSNTESKSFVFDEVYDMLDDGSRTLTLEPGGWLALYGVYDKGTLFLRKSLDSTI
jgi:hypothetical protein